MKKLLIMISLLVFVLLPFTALAGEGPMKLPAGANADSNSHNEEGIDHWNQGHFDVALKHFAMASKIDSGIAAWAFQFPGAFQQTVRIAGRDLLRSVATFIQHNHQFTSEGQALEAILEPRLLVVDDDKNGKFFCL